MIVIGADVHKSTHALAAIDAGTGQLLGEREILATEQGHLEALRWAHEFDQEIVGSTRCGVGWAWPSQRCSTSTFIGSGLRARGSPCEPTFNRREMRCA